MTPDDASHAMEVKGYSARIPYIIDNGVTVTSTPEDGGDSYSYGETIEITVRLSRAILVDFDPIVLENSIGIVIIQDRPLYPDLAPSLRFRLGEPGEAQDRHAHYAGGDYTNTLKFHYIVTSGDTDSDGIEIPGGDVAFGHNLPSAFQGDTTLLDANLEFPALGVQMDHKVDGTPKIDTVNLAEPVRITSVPAIGTTYRNREVVEVTVTFDQPVLVTPPVQASIGIDGGSGRKRRGAAYSHGSGTESVAFQYVVVQDDSDTDGIEIFPNLLAQGGDPDHVDGVQGSGDITSLRGNLAVNLASSGVPDDSGHKVDGSMSGRHVEVVPKKLAVDEGDSAGYMVWLTEEPTGSVTVTVDGFSGTDVSVDNTRLTFTTLDWSTRQTVTVTAGEDNVDIDDPPVTLTHTVAGGGYGSAAADDVTVTVRDNDRQGVTASAMALTVLEGGTAEYTLVLDTEPAEDGTVKVTGASGDVSIDGATDGDRVLTFTSVNWNDPQTVTVRAAEDDDALADDPVTLRNALAGGGSARVTVTVTENDTTTVTVTIGGLSNATTTPENAAWTSPSPTATGGIGALAWSKSGADAALFTQASDGGLTLGAQDYESPADANGDNIYEATVVATDADDNTGGQSIEVTVTDVIETSTVTIGGLSNATTPENAAWTSPTPTVTGVPGVIGEVTWSKSGADAGLFTQASDGRLTLGAQDYEAPADADNDNVYEATVTVTDADANEDTHALEVTVTDVVETSIVTIGGLSNAATPENAAWTSPVPTAAGAIGAVTWSKSGADAGLFTLASDGRLTLLAQDYEAPADADADGVYEVTLRAVDADANEDRHSLEVTVTDVVETATVTIGGLSNATAPENSTWTSPVPTASGAIGAVTWTKSGADAQQFTQGANGTLTLPAQDYETPADADGDNVYEATVVATDADQNTDGQPIEVTVTDVIETSTVTIGGLSNATTPENAAWTSPVPTAAGAIGAVTWTKSGADAGLFTLASDGRLTLLAQDFEAPADADADGVYEVTLRAVDADANEDTHSLEVTVTDVVETSTVTIGGLSNATTPENASWTSPAPSASGVIGAVTWSKSGADAGMFTLGSDGRLTLPAQDFESPADANGDNEYEVTVRAEDEDGNAGTASIEVAVTDVTEVSTLTVSGLADDSAPENVSWTSPRPTVTGMPGVIGEVTWSKSGPDAGAFTLGADGRLTLPAQDYEAPTDVNLDNDYQVTVRAEDADANAAQVSITISVTDSTETSTVTIGGLSNATTPENAAWTSPTPTVTGAIGAVTWTKSGADAGLFTLASDGRLTLLAQDYETPADADADGVYEVTLHAVDADANEDTHSLKVTVSDVVETSTVTIGGLSDATTAENAAWTSPSPTATGEIGAVTWSKSGADAALFTQASDGRLTLGAQDYETPADADGDNVYEATVVATDADQNTDGQPIEVTVTDVIETSIVTIGGLSNATTPENTAWMSPMPTAAGAIGAVTWTKSGADAGLFTQASDGRLTLSAQDFEAPADADADGVYEATLRAVDADANEDTHALEVTVTDVVETATVTIGGLSNATTPENAAWTSPIPTASGAIGAVTWSKSGADAALFTLGADGRLTLGAQDYESPADADADGVYEVTLRAVDADANEDTHSLEVTVTDVVETATVTIGGLSNATTPENAAWTSPSPTATGGIGAVTWSKSGADAALFTQASDGRLTLGAQDYETPADADGDNVYEATVVATDADQNTDGQSIEVIVTDIIETSTVTIGGLSNATAPENATWMSPVPTAAGAIGAVTWTRSGADAALFTLASDGRLTLLAQDYEAPADADADGVYEVTLRAVDADANEDTHALEVTVTDVVETATVTIGGLSNATTPENAAWTSPSPTATGGIGAVTWSKSGADAALFTQASDGRLTLGAQDYEAPADADTDNVYEVTVVAMDADGNTDTHVIEVTVTDVVETSTVTIGGLSDATAPENSTWTSPIPTASGAIGAVTWTTYGADAQQFTQGANGTLTLPARDYETPEDADGDGVYVVEVRAVDADANEDTHSIRVTVTDVVETSTVTIGGLSNATTPENASWTSPAPTASGAIGAVTWNKSGADAALFTQASDGRLTLGAQDYETPADADDDNVYEATVVATDADQNTDGQSIEVTVTDVIETSTVTIGGISNATAPENATWTSPIPTASGAIGAVSWSKSGTDARLFTLGADGRMTLGAQDYESPADADTDNVYEVTLRAMDADANEDTHSIRVTVTDVVETSTVTIGGLSNATTPENAAWTSPVPTAADAIGAVTWTKSGADAGLFTLASDGRLTLLAQDYEAPADADADGVYEVTLRAVDADANEDTHALEVTVTDVIETSTVTIGGLSNATTPENAAWTSPLPTATGGIGAVTWTKSGADAALFTQASDGRLTLGAQDYETPADADGDNVYEATVVATDADQNTDGQSIEVTVTDVIETSAVTIGGLSNATTPENAAWTSPVPTAADAIGAVTWTKSGADAGLFTLASDGRLTLLAQDYEAPADADADGVYEVTLRAVDADANEDTHSLEVTVTDVVESAIVTIGGLSNATTPENAAWTSPSPTATGGIGAVTWSKSGADAALFTQASDGRLTLGAQDYEAPADADGDNVYEATVVATDADGNTDTHSLEVTVTDVIETSAVTIGGLSNATTPENAAWTSPTPTVTGVPGVIGEVTWSKSGADAGLFTLASDGRLTLLAQDYEAPADTDADGVYEVTLRAVDADANEDTHSLEVTVTDVVETATVTIGGLSNAATPENVVWTSPVPTAAGAIGAVTWTRSGADAGLFTLASDGRLTLLAQDYEAPADADVDGVYEVTLRAVDADANEDTHSLEVTVTDVVETATVTIGGLSNATTPENAAWTSPSPTATGGIGAVTWSKSGADAALFTQASDGRLTLGAQDYEAPVDADNDNVYEATVVATDADGNTDTHALEVTVTDVVETSTVTIGGLSNAATPENSTWRSPIPTASGAIGTVTWSKSGADAGMFTLGSDGRLTLPAQDFESPADANGDNEYEVTVRAEDEDGNAGTAWIEVAVTDLTEVSTLTVSGLTDDSAPENVSWTSPRPTVTGVPGVIGEVTWSKSGPDAGAFTLGADGRLTLGAQDYESPADADGDNVYEATVVATDADQNTDGQSIEVTVTDVIETSTVTIGGLSNATAPENSTWTSPVPTASGAIGAVTWTKSGADAQQFTQGANGTLTLPAQDYETPADADGDNVYEATVVATDADQNTDGQPIEVTVTDVIETSTVTIGGLSNATTPENAAWTSPVPTAAGRDRRGDLDQVGRGRAAVHAGGERYVDPAGTGLRDA